MQREIVTFQLGGVANHVGTHWWSLQEAGFIYDPALLPQKEVENDILFRSGLNPRGQETYTPRLLLCDVRSALRTDLSHRCEVETWNGAVEIVERAALGLNKGSDEEDTAMDTIDSSGDTGACYAPTQPTPHQSPGWSDYLVTELHQRSVCCLPRQVEMGFPHTNSYCMGPLCMQNLEFSQLFEDQLHFFVEDCDHLQGFQLLSNLEDGFASLGSQLLNSLSDEFHKSAKYCIPFLPPLEPISSFDTFSTQITMALNLSDWLEHASMLTLLSSSPPSLPLLSHQSLPHQTAAVLAATVDTCSLIYRIPESGMDLQDYTSLLTESGRKLTSLSTQLPFPLLTGYSLQHSLSLCPLSSAVSLTPSMHPSSSPIAACNVVRGIPLSYRLFDVRASSYDSFTSLSDVISHEYGSRYSACASFSLLANCPLPLRHPFPRIFSSEVTLNGLVTSHKSTSSSQGNSIVNSVPVSTSVENHNGLFTFVNNCLQLFDRKTYVQHFSIGQSLETDSIQETRHSLLDLLDRYPLPEDVQSQSDTDSD